MLLAVVASGYLVRILPISLPLPLVQIGLGAVVAGVFGWGHTLDPQLFFLLFLPPLLFLDGWRIPKQGLFRDKSTVIELALGLVLFTVVGAGFLIHWLIPSMPMGVAFALAAILSPTDPVAVSAIAKRAPIPKRLMHILEGESLLNDASGLVCFRFAVAAVMTGAFSLADASLTFLWVAFAGLAIGVGVTWGIAAAQRNAHANLVLLHDPLAVLFLVVRVAPAVAGHLNVVEPETDAGDIKIIDAGVADRGQDAAQVGVGCKKSGLDQGRVRHGVGDFQGLGRSRRLLDLNGHELGGALGVTHDFLR